MIKLITKTLNKIKFHLVELGINTHYKNRGKSQIIMYHGIDCTENKTFNSRFISKENFEKQLILFKKKFEIVDLHTYHHTTPKENQKLRIAITFDDGYQNNFKYALPILEKHQVPATFFITGLNNSKHKIIWSDFYDLFRILTNKPNFTFNNKFFLKKKNHYFTENDKSFPDYFKLDLRPMTVKMNELFEIGGIEMDQVLKDEAYFDYWKLMTDAEISNCARSKYIEIGAHGYSHSNLGFISHEDATLELKKTKSYLKNLCHYEIKSIGYPDGSYTEKLIAESHKLGYKTQCAVKFLFRSDEKNKLILDRYGLYPLTIPESPNRIAYLIEKSSEK